MGDEEASLDNYFIGFTKNTKFSITKMSAYPHA